MAATSNYVDYDQKSEDHRSLLVLVRHTGSALSSQMFNCTYEKISRINGIHVEGQKRNISIQYRKSYSPDFNSWGDFQAHRKVLGLISVGSCSDQTEFEELFSSYKKIKGEYSSTIINSRFIVFGLNTDGTPIIPSEVENNNDAESGNKRSNDVESGIEKDREHDSSICDTTKNDSKSSPNAINKNSSPSSSVKKSPNGTLAPLAEQEEDSEMDQSDHLKPPGVKISGTNSQNSSPRSVAKRQHSNSLTKESSGAEIVFYPSLDKSCDFEDRIKEFVTSLFYVLEGKRLDRSFERNDRLSLLCAPFERKDFVGVDTDTKSFRKKCMGRLRKHLGDLCLQASMPGEAILHYNTALDLLKSVNDFLWMAGCLEGLCCSSIILATPKGSGVTGLRRNLSFQSKGSGSPLNVETKARAGSSSYANGLDTLADVSGHQTLNQDDVIDKFKEAITYYSKFKNAAVIEMETSLKACRFLIQHRRYLQASDFLQNVVYISLPSQDDDKIQRYNTLSNLYHQLGFRRKAAFFKRISGMHCTVPDSSPNWSQCYHLLLQCLEGYGLSLDPTHTGYGQAKGWPALQYRVLHELVFAARRCQHPEVAVRHMTLLVHRMLPFLSVADQREALNGLATLTSKCSTDPMTTKPLALDSGPILPPVVLMSLPSVKSFKLVSPSCHLQPHKLQESNSDGSGSAGTRGVFIYTPLSLTSAKADDSRPDFKWVCGDVCEATLQVFNPLVDDLKVHKMALITSDLETEVLVDSPVIPPSSYKSSSLCLRVKPKEAGTLKIQGYSAVVFGVKSNCRLRDILNLKPSPMKEISIEVIPRLPQVSVSCSLPKSSSSSSSSSSATSLSPKAREGKRGGNTPNHLVDTGSAVLFAGQSVECVVTLQNTSEVPLENVRVWLEGKGDMKGVLKRMIVWSEENIQSQVPLQPSHTLCFSLCISGDSHFLSPPNAHSSPSVSSNKSGSEIYKKKSLEVSLCLEYSGGEGLQAGYCRKCSLGLSIDILPSVFISKWDVQATDRPSHCRLCVDLVNASGHQMTLQYGSEQSVSLGPQQTKRMGLEVLRLDPSQIELNEDVERSQGSIPSMYLSSSIHHSVPDPYSQCLSSGLDIQWTMASSSARGKVHLDYLKWTREQLSVLLLSDMRWDVRLNDHLFSNSYKPRFDIGQIIELQVLVETSEDVWPRDACLNIQVLQTSGRGDVPLDVARYAVLGSPVCRVEKAIQEHPQSPKMSHACSFCFFYAGWYHFNVFLSSTSPHQPSSSSSSSSSASSSLASKTSLPLPLPPSSSSSSSFSSHRNSYNKNQKTITSSPQIRTQQPPSTLLSSNVVVAASSTTSINNNNNNNDNDNTSTSLDCSHPSTNSSGNGDSGSGANTTTTTASTNSDLPSSTSGSGDSTTNTTTTTANSDLSNNDNSSGSGASTTNTTTTTASTNSDLLSSTSGSGDSTTTTTTTTANCDLSNNDNSSGSGANITNTTPIASTNSDLPSSTTGSSDSTTTNTTTNTTTTTTTTANSDLSNNDNISGSGDSSGSGSSSSIQHESSGSGGSHQGLNSNTTTNNNNKSNSIDSSSTNATNQNERGNGDVEELNSSNNTTTTSASNNNTTNNTTTTTTSASNNTTSASNNSSANNNTTTTSTTTTTNNSSTKKMSGDTGHCNSSGGDGVSCNNNNTSNRVRPSVTPGWYFGSPIRFEIS